jgi:hypothetical protein
MDKDDIDWEISADFAAGAPQARKRRSKQFEGVRSVRTSRLLVTGAKIGICEVLGPVYVKGRFGVYSNRLYSLKCRCGKQIEATYHQIYYGNVYSCGCEVRPKHPPIRLEGRTIGCLEVLRWAIEEAAWELVCLECGAILYLQTTREVREQSADCSTHKLAAVGVHNSH